MGTNIAVMLAALLATNNMGLDLDRPDGDYRMPTEYRDKKRPSDKVIFSDEELEKLEYLSGKEKKKYVKELREKYAKVRSDLERKSHHGECDDS